jgi:hypothetical protein
LADEVEDIARAGGINFDAGSNQVKKFEKTLDSIRSWYEHDLKQKGDALTDRQIADRLSRAQSLAIQLCEVLKEPALQSQLIYLTAVKQEYWELIVDYPEPIERIVRWADFGLKELARRSAVRPNAFAKPSAEKTGLTELVFDLARLWCVATGTMRPQVGINSTLIPFLIEGVGKIADFRAGIDTARKWARQYARYAASHSIPGYFFESRSYSRPLEKRATASRS